MIALQSLWRWAWGDSSSKLSISSNSPDSETLDDRDNFGHRDRPRVGAGPVEDGKGPRLFTQRGVKGIVTIIFESTGTGVVDGCMDFDLDVIQSGKQDTNTDTKSLPSLPLVGSLVIVDRERRSRLDRWKISKLEILSQPKQQDSVWADLEDPSQNKNQSVDFVTKPLYQKRIGMITRVFRDKAILSEELEFPTNVCVDGYWVEPGDWVVLWFDPGKLSEGEQVVTKINPLRCLDFEGQITFSGRGHGFINRKINYKVKSIKDNDFYPKNGDAVYGTAIESVQSKDINFRAISLYSKKNVAPFQLTGTNVEIPLSLRPSCNYNFLRDVSLIGLKVTPERIHFGRVPISDVRQSSVSIQNIWTTPIELKSIVFQSLDNDQYDIGVLLLNSKQEREAITSTNVVLNPDDSLELTISLSGRYPGRDDQFVVITISDNTIGIECTATIIDPLEETLQVASNPSHGFTGLGRGHSLRQRQAQLATQAPPRFVMPGVKPMHIASQAVAYVPCKLKRYAIPERLRQLVLSDQDVTEYLETLNQPLTWNNYLSKLSCCVHLDEIEAEVSIRQFDLFSVILERRGEMLVLVVPGLAEGRPSLVVGDKVCLKSPQGNLGKDSFFSQGSGVIYEGFVHEVHRESVLVKFHPSFHASYTGQPYDASFTYSRTPYRRMQQAIEYAHRLGKEVLFPSTLLTRTSQCLSIGNYLSSNSTILDSHKSKQARQFVATNFATDELNDRSQLIFFNPSLNDLQRSAVIRILHGYSRPTPYILFGPPGTGKTVTVVEAILQVYHRVPSSRILVCAPSNSAADLLCSRLHSGGTLQPGEMVRLNAHRRTVMSALAGEEVMSPEIVPYCLGVDKVDEVAMHRIVVSTCVSSGILYTLGLTTGHFTHAFIDEAGQAMEPECLIPLGLVAASSGQVILAGDPKQLGPVVMSRLASKYGLSDSLLHRLVDTSPLYAKSSRSYSKPTTTNSDTVSTAHRGGYDPLVLTKLVNNYRSHAGLLALPSQLFYDAELVACADKTLVSSIENWRGLVNPKCPLVVHGVRGEEQREGNSPSWMNATEAVILLKYVAMLLKDSDELNIRPSDIGIITPYRKQVEKLRQLLNASLNLPPSQHDSIKLGSVEEFQGQERRVILLSTVRTAASLERGWETGLGFLSQPGRFNVSVTRAQCLLIVVGDPCLLVRDSNWSQLIAYSRRNNCYTGCDLTGVEDMVT